MKALLLFLSLYAILLQPLKAQINIIKPSQITGNFDTAELAIQKYYRLAVQYKEGKGILMDYQKAFDYFQKAANLGDSQSVYAIGYMHYKGFGCRQDYALAARLFAQGAYGGRDNSMYFYGLAWRNGYGLPQNEDSAQYWLKKAAALGYKQAILELQSRAPENSNAQAEQLVQKIHNAALPEQIPLNQFIPVQPKVPDSTIIAGDYEGYVIQYDWSGKHPVSTKKLHLFLERGQTNLTGKWLEEGADSVTIQVALQKDSLVFNGTNYKRRDHYSLDRGIEYDFQNAALNLVRKEDSVYLAGNIYMFSPDRKEPSKPLLVALVRTVNKNKADSNIDTASETTNAKLLSVYPNPFTSYVNVEFEMNEATKVGIELYDIEGKRVYAKPPQPLVKGTYKIRIEPSKHLTQQTYILRLVFTGGQEAVKVIKK